MRVGTSTSPEIFLVRHDRACRSSIFIFLIRYQRGRAAAIHSCGDLTRSRTVSCTRVQPWSLWVLLLRLCTAFVALVFQSWVWLEGNLVSPFGSFSLTLLCLGFSNFPFLYQHHQNAVLEFTRYVFPERTAIFPLSPITMQQRHNNIIKFI